MFLRTNFITSQNKQCLLKLLSEEKNAEASVPKSLSARPELGSELGSTLPSPATGKWSESFCELDVAPCQFATVWLMPWNKGCSELYYWFRI